MTKDEQIVYAATNIWLGTNTAHLTPLGVAVSVDGGRQWLQLSLLQDGNPAVRASAARAIGLIGDAAALPGLLQALADPDTPDSKALDEFLVREKAVDPISFPDLSFAVIKLLISRKLVHQDIDKDLVLPKVW